jgi:hypothetical protein
MQAAGRADLSLHGMARFVAGFGPLNLIAMPENRADTSPTCADNPQAGLSHV